MANIFNSDAFWSWARHEKARIVVFLVTRSIIRAIPNIAVYQLRDSRTMDRIDFQHVLFTIFDSVSLSYTSSLSDAPSRFLDKASVLSSDGLIVANSISSKYNGAPELVSSAGMAAKLFELERPGSVQKGNREFKVRVREILERISNVSIQSEEVWAPLTRESEIVDNLSGLDSIEVVQILNSKSLWIPEEAQFIYERWIRLRSFIESCDVSWGDAWLSWFQDRIDGSEVSSRRGREYIYELEFSRVLRPFSQSFDRDWKIVNPYLISIEEQFRSKPRVEDTFYQSVAPHYFEVSSGTIRLSATKADLSVSESMRNEMWEGLSFAIGKFHEQRIGANVHIPSDVLEILASLTRNLGIGADAVRPGTIQSDWRRLKREINRLSETRGIGDSRLDVSLLNILDALEDFRSCYKDCRAIDAEGIRLGITARNVEDVLVQQKNLASLVEGIADNIVDAAAKSAQSATLRLALAEKDISVKAELAADQALTQRNFASVVLNEVKVFGRETWKKTRDNVSTEFAAAAGLTTKWGIRVLAFKVFGPILGLAAIVEGFEALAKKLEQLAEQGVFDEMQDDATLNAEDERDDDTGGRI